MAFNLSVSELHYVTRSITEKTGPNGDLLEDYKEAPLQL
jgi:hypothetical protein